MTQLIGAAFGSDPDPVKHAQSLGAQCFQIQAGDPQGWKKPALDFPGGAKELAQLVKENKMAIYIHAAYVIMWQVPIIESEYQVENFYNKPLIWQQKLDP